MKKLISRTLAIATLLSILGVLWYLCHLAMYAMPINYLKPTATAMLFVLLLNVYGRARDNSSETKDKT